MIMAKVLAKTQTALFLLVTLVAFVAFVGCGGGTPAGECTSDYEGHDLCQQRYGMLHFCGPELMCIEASGCAALECCVPGERGDQWCQATFGEVSRCHAGTDGACL